MQMMQFEMAEPINRMVRQQSSASSQGKRHTLQAAAAAAWFSAFLAWARLAALVHQLVWSWLVAISESNSFSSWRCLIGCCCCCCSSWCLIARLAPPLEQSTERQRLMIVGDKMS